VDRTFLDCFCSVLREGGYKVGFYGWGWWVFNNPSLNGYWVAEYAGRGPFMYNHSSVRATQYANGQFYDSSSIQEWTYYSGNW
jgi:hypothetical protein